MDKTFLKELYHYNHHFNQALINLILLQDKQISERILELLNHTLNAHYEWNHRIMGKKSEYGIWEKHMLQNLKEIDLLNYRDSLEILENEDFDRMVSYTNSQQLNFKNLVKDILFHIINHSTYHRAQIATDLKNAGIQPLISDYIIYKRNQNLNL